MTAVFITATGTDIGKTFLTAGLIRHIRGAGGAVAAIKPIVSGFDPGAWEKSDPAVLLGALGRPVAVEEVERISPWRFKGRSRPTWRASARVAPSSFRTSSSFAAVRWLGTTACF